jgi:hypothetical protein
MFYSRVLCIRHTSLYVPLGPRDPYLQTIVEIIDVNRDKLVNDRGSDLRTGRSSPGVCGGIVPRQAGPIACRITVVRSSFVLFTFLLPRYTGKWPLLMRHGVHALLLTSHLPMALINKLLRFFERNAKALFSQWESYWEDRLCCLQYLSVDTA